MGKRGVGTQVLTCNVTYYNEPHLLLWWFRTIRKLNDSGIDIKLSICDDGSQRLPAEKFFEKHKPLPSMSLYRVKEDIGFNSHGARNLLMKQTKTGWNLLSDIDRNYSIETLTKLYNGKRTFFRRGNYYSFVHRGVSSINEYVIYAKDFWLSGGYDEEFVNIHWGDRLFLKSVRQNTKNIVMHDMPIKYVRHARKVMPGDVATTQYPDDHTLITPAVGIWANAETRQKLLKFVQKRNSTHAGRMSKKVINFEWEQMF